MKGDCTPLMEAASAGHTDIVRYISVDKKTVLWNRIRFNTADPDPLHETDQSSKKAREIHIKIDLNYKNIVFKKKKKFIFYTHESNLLVLYF